MKMHDGGLMAFLNSKTQEKAQTGNVAPEKENIVWIDARELVRNEKNFYGIRDVAELAALIAASGVIEPLTVTPTEDGKYRIVAGERRTAATLLRLERGDIIDPKVPCIVKTFDSSGSLSAEDKEMLCLIASNRGQRQTRTALEKLQEIEELEPIAKKIFQDEQIQGTFRKFFAEQVLSISPAKLQRLKSLAKLVDEGRAALEIGMLSESAALELATHTEEEQNDYLHALVDDLVQNRAEDVKVFFRAGIINGPASQAYALSQEETENNFDAHEDAGFPSQNSEDGESGEHPAPVVPENTDSNNEKEQSTGESNRELVNEKTERATTGEGDSPAILPSEKKPRTQKTRTDEPSNATINIDVPIPADMNMEQMEHEADTWMETILSDSIKIAEAKTEEARAEGETKIAALWDSRRAKAVLVLETVRE